MDFLREMLVLYLEPRIAHFHVLFGFLAACDNAAVVVSE